MKYLMKNKKILQNFTIKVILRLLVVMMINIINIGILWKKEILLIKMVML